MNHLELRRIISEHFDRSPEGQGQFVFGEWFVPKHKDSLQYLLQALGHNPHVFGG